MRWVVLIDRIYDRSIPVRASGAPLDEIFTADMLRGMNVHDISLLHDHKALRGPAFAGTAPAMRTPIPIVDMIFSQPLRRV